MTRRAGSPWRRRTSGPGTVPSYVQTSASDRSGPASRARAGAATIRYPSEAVARTGYGDSAAVSRRPDPPRSNHRRETGPLNPLYTFDPSDHRRQWNARTRSLARLGRFGGDSRKSADVGGSRWIGIGKQGPAVKGPMEGRRGRGFLAHGRERRRRHGCNDGCSADGAAEHCLHGAVARLVRTIRTVAIMHHRRHWHRRHLGSHGAAFGNRQTHTRGDDYREEQTEKLSARPVPHNDGEDDAKAGRTQAATICCQIRMPAAPTTGQ